MKCPDCGHTMNHHADKFLLDAGEPDGEAGAPLFEAYTCPHCGANAGKVIEPA